MEIKYVVNKFPYLSDELGLPNYTYEELLVATDNKAPTNLLGVGGFGKVFLGHVRHTNVAIKFFHQVSVDMAIFFMSEVLMQYHVCNYSS